MRFNDYLTKRIESGDRYAARFLKKGKVPLQLVIDECKLNGTRTELIESAEQKGMLSGDLELTYDGANRIYEKLKEIARKNAGEGKTAHLDVIDSLDVMKNHTVIANLLFSCDPEIRKRVQKVENLYRVVLNVGSDRDKNRKGYGLEHKPRREKYNTGNLLTPELQKLISSIPQEVYNSESEEARRLRVILKRMVDGEVFPVFKNDQREAFSLLEKAVIESDNINLRQAYESARERYTEYSSFNVDVANPKFIDPKTKQLIPLPSLHQKIALYHILKEKRFGVFDGCGTGKTAIGVLAQPLIEREMQKDGKEFRRTVIVCPNNGKKAWKAGLIGNETQRYLVEPQDVIVVDGKEKKDEEFFKNIEKSKWIVLNKEQLNVRLNKGEDYFASYLAKLGVDYVILDEAHNFKSQKETTAGGRLTESAAARILSLNVPYLCLLTGTPIPDKPEDYAVMYHLLNPRDCPRPKDFKAKYEENPRILYTFFSEKSIRRTSEDINDDLISENNDVDIELDPLQRKLYNHIVEFRPTGWLIQARKALVDPRLVEPEILREAGVLGEITYRNSAKYKTLADMLNAKDSPIENKDKFVIFSSMFREGITQKNHESLRKSYVSMGLSNLYDKLQLERSLDVLLKEDLSVNGTKLNIGVIDGTKEVEERESLVDRLSKDLDGLLVTTDTGGESLSMVAANWAFSLDEDYAPKTEEQKRARLLRKGQTKPVHFITLRGKDTLDIPLREYVKKKVIINTIAVDGLPPTPEEADLLNDTEGKQFGEMIKRGLGGKSINVLEGKIDGTDDFSTIKRISAGARDYSISLFAYTTTEAQELMKWIGKDPVNCWKDPAFVELYMKTLPNLAVPVIHRAKICDLVRRAKNGTIEFPKKVISEGSGPSLLFESYQSLRDVVKNSGLDIPDVTDRDFSEIMLAQGRNPNKIMGDMTGKNSVVADSTFDMVDNESISLLVNKDQVKDSLLEANRILKPNGTIELIVKNLRFVPEFYNGMEKLGFKVLSDKNEGFKISREFKDRLRHENGAHFADSYSAKLNNTHLLIAKKVDKPADNVQSTPFWFEPVSAAISDANIESTQEEHNRPVNVRTHIDNTVKKLEKESKGGAPAKKEKKTVRVLPESIPGLKVNGEVVTEEV